MFPSRIWILGLGALGCLSTQSADLAAAAPATNFSEYYARQLDRLPMGSLSATHLRVCSFDARGRWLGGNFVVWSLDLRVPQQWLRAPSPEVACQSDGSVCFHPFRAKYGFGHLWIVDPSPGAGAFPCFSLDRYPVTVVEPRRAVGGAARLPTLERLYEDRPIGDRPFRVGSLDPLINATDFLERPKRGVRLVPLPVQWDIVPTGQTTCLLIVLAPADKKIEIHEVSCEPPAKGKPKARVEKLSLHFTGGFRAFERPEGMYFVTESGKVHLARKAKKGRAWETVWDDPKRPVSAVLIDEDRKGKVILCGFDRQRPPLTQRPFLFALVEKPTVHAFETDAVTPVLAPRPLGTLAEFAQLAGKVR